MISSEKPGRRHPPSARRAAARGHSRRAARSGRAGGIPQRPQEEEAPPPPSTSPIASRLSRDRSLASFGASSSAGRGLRRDLRRSGLYLVVGIHARRLAKPAPAPMPASARMSRDRYAECRCIGTGRVRASRESDMTAFSEFLAELLSARARSSSARRRRRGTGPTEGDAAILADAFATARPRWPARRSRSTRGSPARPRRSSASASWALVDRERAPGGPAASAPDAGDADDRVASTCRPICCCGTCPSSSRRARASTRPIRWPRSSASSCGVGRSRGPCPTSRRLRSARRISAATRACCSSTPSGSPPTIGRPGVPNRRAAAYDYYQLVTGSSLPRSLSPDWPHDATTR